MSNEPMLMMMQAAPAGRPGGTTGILMGSLPWLPIFVIFYFLMIRPQQQRVKQHQAAINAVKKGDEVVTGGGIRGRVTKVSDDEAEVEIAQGVKVRVVKSTISQVLTPEHEAGQRLMLEFPRWKVWLVSAHRRARRPAVDPEPARRHAACRQLAEVASAIQDQPGPRPCRRQPAAARSRCAQMRRSSGFRRWKIRSRPSSAAIQRIDIGDISTAGGRLSFLVRNPTQVDAAVERMRTLTQPVALTGNRDWDVQVVDSTRVVLTPTASGTAQALKDAMSVARDVVRRRIDPRRHQGNHGRH